LVLEHLEDLPMLVFATWQSRIQWKQPAPDAVPIRDSSQAQMFASVLALDKRDGRLIPAVPKNEADPLQHTLGLCHSMNVDLRAGTVELMTSGNGRGGFGYKVVFVFNDQRARPPNASGGPAEAAPGTSPGAGPVPARTGALPVAPTP
jgi:hypothetical protein